MTIVDITQTELMLLPSETRKRILDRAASDAENAGCYDHQPPSTRDNAIEIAAHLARTVEGEYRPLACEAARKLKELHEAQRKLASTELACAMGHVIIASGVIPGIDVPCRCEECRLVASRLDEAGYMEGVDDRWWDSAE